MKLVRAREIAGVMKREGADCDGFPCFRQEPGREVREEAGEVERRGGRGFPLDCAGAGEDWDWNRGCGRAAERML